jgi:hypothetical protein
LHPRASDLEVVLGHENVSDLVGFLATSVASSVVDRLWGDKIAEWIRSTIPSLTESVWVEHLVFVPGLLILLLLLAGYLRQGKESPPMSVSNVTSYNQSGGITAQQVNIEQPRRHVDDRLKVKMLNELPRDKPVEVVTVMGDTEAHAFAEEMLQFLKTSGFDASGVTQAIFAEPVRGIDCHTYENPMQLIIGSR